MKIALVHDYLVQYGGAERVLECFTELFPEAPIYTLVYDKEAMHGVFEGKEIITSFLQKMPFARRRHRVFPPLMPLAIEQFDLSEYDVVLSDSSSFAKGIITGPETLHICYMHTPMRYAWDDCQKYIHDFGFPRFIKNLVPLAMNYIRLWDKASVDRVDRLIANSEFVAKRIKKYYRKEAVVINPPVNVDNFQISNKRKDYFLMVGRLIAYKRHDIAIQVFNDLGLPLKIIGRGPELKRLQKIAGPNVEFLGRIPESELPRYYAECRAFIFPQEEDFGIVAIEAMAAGRPLIAFRGGDIAEHLEDGKTGIFFDKQEVASLAQAVRKYRDGDFDPAYIRQKVEKFHREKFKEAIKSHIERCVAEHNGKRL